MAAVPRWRMICIGPGPGPKNVLAENTAGDRVCVPYAIWKHRLSKEIDVSEATEKVYVTAIGVVQQFGKDKPAVSSRELGGVNVASFTIQTSNQGYLGINVWPEMAASGILDRIKAGVLVGIRGEYSESVSQTNGQTYRNVKALSISPADVFYKAEREVVNQQAPAAAPAQATAQVSGDVAPAATYSF